MEYVIGGADLQGSIEQAIDDAMGKASPKDQIVLTHAAAAALLDEFDALRDEAPAKPRFLHVLTDKVEQLVRVEAISCVAVDPTGRATVAFAGGGLLGFDAVDWRLLFSHIKEYVDLEMVPVAPPSKLIS
jgi:hypothetical protein